MDDERHDIYGMENPREESMIIFFSIKCKLMELRWGINFKIFNDGKINCVVWPHFGHISSSKRCFSLETPCICDLSVKMQDDLCFLVQKRWTFSLTINGMMKLQRNFCLRSCKHLVGTEPLNCIICLEYM